jgi:hypothetical protein
MSYRNATGSVKTKLWWLPWEVDFFEELSIDARLSGVVFPFCPDFGMAVWIGGRAFEDNPSVAGIRGCEDIAEEVFERAKGVFKVIHEAWSILVSARAERTGAQLCRRRRSRRSREVEIEASATNIA